jgi:predicted Zn finger-like uncharacterized protein
MRLICPSCGAQYEVDADLIPDAGRDVQCSACGHVWFEEPGASVAAEAGVAALPEVEEAPATVADAPPVQVRAPRRTVTPAIAEILREEAEREKAARAAEAQAALERQEELPLVVPERVAETAEPPAAAPEPAPAAKPEVPEASAGPVQTSAVPERDKAEGGGTDVAAALRAMVARAVEEPPTVRPVPSMGVPAAAVRPAEPPPVRPAPPAPVPRRDRLPDIEEINSTLNPGLSGAARMEAREPTKQGGRSFRLGFGLVLLVAAGLALVYVYAPRIVVALPQSEGVIGTYVAAVDEGRLWLDLRLQDLLAMMGGAEDSAE